jgi:hypothetical protein
MTVLASYLNGTLNLRNAHPQIGYVEKRLLVAPPVD